MKRPEGFLNHELLEFFVDPKRPVMVGVFESDGVVIIIFADVLCYPHLCWCALLLHFQYGNWSPIFACLTVKNEFMPRIFCQESVG